MTPCAAPACGITLHLCLRFLVCHSSPCLLLILNLAICIVSWQSSGSVKRLDCAVTHRHAAVLLKRAGTMFCGIMWWRRVLRLLYRREKWLVVAAVRFLRTCLGLKDDFYNRYLVSSHT